MARTLTRVRFISYARFNRAPLSQLGHNAQAPGEFMSRVSLASLPRIDLPRMPQHLLQRLADDHTQDMTDRRCAPAREQTFSGNPSHLLTDHIPMPNNAILGLERLGAQKLLPGPRMRLTSQRVVLIHYELAQGQGCSESPPLSTQPGRSDQHPPLSGIPRKVESLHWLGPCLGGGLVVDPRAQRGRNPGSARRDDTRRARGSSSQRL